jgi:hypothetical protein
MLKLHKRYSSVIGLPTGLITPRPGTWLDYSPHSLKSHSKDGVRREMLPDRLPPSFRVVEVSTFAGKAMHWVVRFPQVANINGKAVSTGKDIVLALGFRGAESLTVRTVYLNDRTDTHHTLNKEKYDRPE